MEGLILGILRYYDVCRFKWPKDHNNHKRGLFGSNSSG